ncbi:MAG: hypothetical protein V1489_01210 [Candidatus Liptonbacteria bacterium]
MAGIVKESFAGLQTLSGGTRTAVKTVRPWQAPLVYPDAEHPCPFCTRQQTDEHFVRRAGMEWKTFANNATPFPYHRLLVPDRCWPESLLRRLGGALTLKVMIQLALDELVRTRPQIFPTWIYTHIGYGSGQNFPHLHWHLCGAPGTVPPARTNGFPPDAATLFDSKYASSAACGVRAGQVLILPKEEGVLWNDTAARADLIEHAHRVVKVFNRRFNKPDYCLFFALNDAEDWHCRYTPILNNWGGSEFAALEYETPFVLPWPHEATVEYLLKEE